MLKNNSKSIANTIDLQIVSMTELFVVIGKNLLNILSVQGFVKAIYIRIMIVSDFSSK